MQQSNDKEKTLTQKLYFMRAMIDIILQSVPAENRNKIINQAIIDKLNDDYDEINFALIDYERICEEVDEAENLEELRKENNKQAYIDFGDDYNYLIGEINSKMKNDDESVGVYIGRKQDGHVYLQIIDEVGQRVLRTYDDIYDLKINMDRDLKTKFKYPKIEISKNVKPLDLKNKKNNKE